jgi:hypothetical protein
LTSEAIHPQFRAIIRGVDTSSFSSPSDYAKTEPRTEDPTNEHPIVILSAAGHDAENVEAFVERTGDVAVFGRFFSMYFDIVAGPSRRC